MAMESVIKNSAPHNVKDRSKFAQDFERTVQKAGWLGYAERLWDRAVPTTGLLTAAFLTASWSGAMWEPMLPSMRIAGVALFGVALAASLIPLFKVKPLGREDALARMDMANGAGRLASTYDDIPAATENMSADSSALWDLQRRKIEKQVGSFKAGKIGTGSILPRIDPYGLRFAALVAVGLAFGNACYHDEVQDYLMQAFDWNIQAPDSTPAKLDAWVRPPAYTGQKPLFIASKEVPGQRQGTFTVPAHSLFTVTVHDRNVEIDKDGGGSSVATSCEMTGSGFVRKCTFDLVDDTKIHIRKAGTSDLTWHFNVTPDLPPQVTIDLAPQPTRSTAQPDINITFKAQDEYGVTVPEMELKLKPPADSEAKPLPFYNPSKIVLPVR